MSKRATTTIDIHELIATRWSPRAFADTPVTADDLRQLLEAARWAASCFNEQPWRFIVARRDEPEAFEALLGCVNDKNAAWARQAGALIMTLAKTTFSHNGKANRHAWHDVGLAVGNLSLEATARGIGLHQLAGFDADRARAVYRLSDDLDPVTIIAVGHPGDADALPAALADKERAPRTRKPLSELSLSGRSNMPS